MTEKTFNFFCSWIGPYFKFLIIFYSLVYGIGKKGLIFYPLLQRGVHVISAKKNMTIRTARIADLKSINLNNIVF